MSQVAIESQTQPTTLAQPRGLKRLALLFLAPCILYLIAWCVLTWPLVTHFGTHFFSDAEDGMAFVWIFWWFDKAIFDLHQSPLYTTFLHCPYGISLLSHPPMFFNNMVSLLALRFIPLQQTFNLILILCFVLSGWTMFLLCRCVTGHYLASLAGGWLFTFSSYHFAHAESQMNLATTQWMPLFLMAWWSLLEKPNWKKALVATGSLMLVVGSDTYYFLYCVLAAALVFCWAAFWRRDALFFARRESAVPLAVFIIASLATAGIFIAALVISNIRDPLNAPHPPWMFSLDLLAPFVYSAEWRFGELTRPVWSRYVTNATESSVHLGLAVLVTLVFVLVLRRRLEARRLGVWASLLIFFLLLAMGPTLQIFGRVLHIPMPYSLLETILPPLKLAGTPVRMTVMVFLASAVLFSAVLAWMLRKSWQWKVAAVLLFGAMVFEQWPRTPPHTQLAVPPSIELLRKRPGKEAVIDIAASLQFWRTFPDVLPIDAHKHALYYQTVHERPIAMGFVARVPESVHRKDGVLVLKIAAGKYAEIRDQYGFRYVLIPTPMKQLIPTPEVDPIYSDWHSTLYDLWDLR